MPKDEKNGVKSLDFEIQMVKVLKFADKFDRAMKKNIKNDLKKAAILFGPLVILAAGGFSFNIPILFAVGASLTGVGAISYLVADLIQDFKNVSKNTSRELNVVNFRQEDQTVDEVLKEGIEQSKDEDYYTEYYKQYSSRVESESERNYREAVEQQKKAMKMANIYIVDDVQGFNQEETMIQIVKEIDVYCTVYNIPPLNISNNEWEVFFDILYKRFCEKGIENQFYDIISEIVRITFASSLVNKTNFVSIQDIINDLSFLEILAKVNERRVFEKKEISAIQQTIRSNFNASNVINFTDYAGKKMK